MDEEEIMYIIEKLQCECKERENEEKYYKYVVKKFKEYSNGLQGLLDLYKQEKEKNKKLDRENQALYESINCNDDNMLARLYKEEKEQYKVLEDDLKMHRIAYIDTPEFEEQFISKDKIKEIINQLEYDEQKTRDIKYTRGTSHTQYLSEYDKIRLKAYITKTKEIKNRLKELLEEE